MRVVPSRVGRIAERPGVISIAPGCMSRYRIEDVQRFDVKDNRVTGFQLESLILAQNERWRQA